MSKHSYQLINPVIQGTFKDTYDASKPIKAAEDMWLNLSEHIVGHVPRFMFTMKNISNNDLHSFEVKESKEKNKYIISNIEIKATKKDFDSFLEQVDKFGEKIQTGGKDKVHRKRYEEDDSSSTSSSDYYPSVRRTSPISIFHYNTRVYYDTYGGLTVTTPITSVPVVPCVTCRTTLNPVATIVNTPVFTPVFKVPLSPFIAIW